MSKRWRRLEKVSAEKILVEKGRVSRREEESSWGTCRVKGSLSLLDLWRLKDNSLRNQMKKKQKLKNQKTHCTANMSAGPSLAIT